MSRAVWQSTEAQIKAVVDDLYYSYRDYKSKYIGMIPISKIADLIPFYETEYEPHYMDPKGGPAYCAKLAKHMEQGTPLPPAHGWVKGKKYYLFDGNHRVSAAILAGLKEIPFVVRKPPTK